jgi:hypothetical protein
MILLLYAYNYKNKNKNKSKNKSKNKFKNKSKYKNSLLKQNSYRCCCVAIGRGHPRPATDKKVLCKN